MPKIIRIISKDHAPWRNISKPNFWLVIYIDKNFIWTTLKAIISIFFLHPQIPDFQIIVSPNKPHINGKLIYSSFRWSINLHFEKLTLKTDFVVQGHIFYNFCTVINAVNYHWIIHMYYTEKTWKTHKAYRLHVSSVKFYACYSA